jgi:5-methyltetrahydrofolate--homocysteine methyltransferase
MILVGERLNSSRHPVLNALDKKDEKYIIEEALRQEKAGADYIDLNTAALLDKEIQTLKWAIPLLQKELSIPLSIDTPNPDAMNAGLMHHKGKALLNSLSGESKRIKTFLPLIKEYRPQVVALCLDDEGLPKNPDEELSIAQKLVELLEKAGVKQEDVFIDPLVQPIGVDHNAANLFFDSLEKIKKSLPGIKTIAGISNVSFGIPQRRLVNWTFIVLALQKGLDAAILDPLDKKILASLVSAQALLGKDPSLKNYLSFIRKSQK